MGLNVNLGSGHRPREGYINVDFRDVDGVDIQCDVRNVEKIGPGIYDSFLAEHILEHFSYRETANVLKCWFELLKPGGSFQIDVPNGEWQVKAVVNNEITWDSFVNFAYGDQDYEGNYHFTNFDRHSLYSVLYEAGFVNVIIKDVGQVLVATGNCPL